MRVRASHVFVKSLCDKQVSFVRQWCDRDFAVASDKQLESRLLVFLGGSPVAEADSRESTFELARQMRDLAPDGDCSICELNPAFTSTCRNSTFRLAVNDGRTSAI